MAGLKYMIDDGSGNQVVHPESYVKLAEAVQKEYNFLNEFTSKELIQFLEEVAKDQNSNLTYDDGEPVIPRRVKLRVEFDDDNQQTRRGKKKFMINLPSEVPLSLTYLNPYISYLERTGGGAPTPEQKQKFLFAMLCLTKCR